MSGYYSIPHHIFNDTNLNHRQKILFAILHGFLHKQEFVKYTNKKLSELNQCSIRQVKQDINILSEQNYIEIKGMTLSRKIYKGVNYHTHKQLNKQIELHPVDNSQLGADLVPNIELLGTKSAPSTWGEISPKLGDPLYIYKITKKEITNNQDLTKLEHYQSERKTGWLVGCSLFENIKTHFEQTPPESITQKTMEEFYKQAEYHISKRVIEKGLTEQQAFNQFLKMINKSIFETPNGYISEQKTKATYTEYKREPEISVEQMQANRKRLAELLRAVIK